MVTKWRNNMKSSLRTVVIRVSMIRFLCQDPLVTVSLRLGINESFLAASLLPVSYRVQLNREY